MRSLPPDLDPAVTTFVDVGSGLGRVAFLAAAYPFKQIVGVEVSPALHEIAKDNRARFLNASPRCRDIRLVRADASTWTPPKGDLLVYLYNPFDAELMAVFANRLRDAANARKIWVMYHTPAQPDPYKETAAFAAVLELPFGVLYRLI